MDYKAIEQLLEKYFDGHSSLEEEQQLQQFFEKNKKLPPALESAALMFRHFQGESAETMPQPIMRVSRNRQRNRIWQLSGIAASILIVLSAIFWMPGSMDQGPAYAYINGQPVNNEEVALEEMKKALSIMTSHLNQGTEGLSQLSKFEQIKKSISK